MPEELKKYFWDTQYEKLDKEKNKRYIISRLYCYGDLKAIKWINDNYTKEDIEDVARHRRDLTPLVANYLRQKFNLKKENMAYYRVVKAMNYEFWKNTDNKTTKRVLQEKEINGIDDVGNKIISLGIGSTTEDFNEIYQILKDNNITAKELVEVLKQRDNINYANVIMGITYFEDAENTSMKDKSVKESWEKIKRFFIELQTELQKSFINGL